MDSLGVAFPVSLRGSQQSQFTDFVKGDRCIQNKFENSFLPVCLGAAVGLRGLGPFQGVPCM